MIGNTFSTLKDTVSITLDEEIGEIFIKNKRLSSPLQWQFLSKQGESTLLSRTMRYGHEAQPRLKSINADFLWLVEATELPQEAFTIGLSRLRKAGKDGYYPIVVETNPSSKQNWVYKAFLEDSVEKYRNPDNTWWIQEKDVQHRIGQTVYNLKIRAINTTTLANPHFPETTLSLMQSTYSPAEIARLIYGEWNANEGRVIEVYTVFDVPADLKGHASKYDRIILGADPGFDHPTCVMFIGQKGDQWEAFDEIYVRESSIRKVYADVMTRLETWGLEKRELIINIDPSASGWMAEWQDIAGQRIWAYKARHRGTDPALNRAIRIGEKLRIKKLQVSALCKNLINDFEQTVYKKGAKEQIDKQSYDPHALDALGYGITEFI